MNEPSEPARSRVRRSKGSDVINNPVPGIRTGSAGPGVPEATLSTPSDDSSKGVAVRRSQCPAFSSGTIVRFLRGARSRRMVISPENWAQFMDRRGGGLMNEPGAGVFYRQPRPHAIASA